MICIQVGGTTQEKSTRGNGIMQNHPAGKKLKILIISDEPATATIWGYSLTQVGLEVTLIALTDAIMETWETEIPDLIIIEDFNEEMGELDVCKMLRDVTAVPILFLTTKLSENFQLDVYKAGADECIPFPITPRLFQAKVNAWLRQTRSLPMLEIGEIAAGDFRLDPGERVISLPHNGGPVKLTTLETRLLILLLSNAGKVLAPADIIEKVWGYHNVDDHKLVKNHIFRLRRKIETDPAHPRYLISVGSTGYKFQPAGE
jgi:DNA-binding response OmpR family regulator